MLELKWWIKNYNSELIERLRNDLKEVYTVEYNEQIQQFLSELNLKFFDHWISLWRFLYSFNNKYKKKNHENDWDSWMIIDLWILVDWIFNILILDIDNNKTYYFTCYLDKITETLAIDWINAESLLQVLDNDKNLFKEYILDLMLSTWFTFQNFLDLLVSVQKNNQNFWWDFLWENNFKISNQ